MQPRDILLFHNPDQSVKVSVYFQNGNFWLTQKAMAELFDVERSVITKHLNNIFKTEELDKDSVCAKIAHTAEDGKTYSTNFYPLEAILAVGYRVNSMQATDFRKWEPSKEQNSQHLIWEHLLESPLIKEDFLEIVPTNELDRVEKYLETHDVRPFVEKV
jgi:hypothetical protein